jgi:hypothetical protein
VAATLLTTDKSTVAALAEKPVVEIKRNNAPHINCIQRQLAQLPIDSPNPSIYLTFIYIHLADNKIA